MPPRPRASLDDLTVPKGAGLPAPPPPATDPPSSLATSRKNYAHTLSLRLTAEQYRRLRHYVARLEDEDGGRVTHQSVIEAALAYYLNQHGG